MRAALADGSGPALQTLYRAVSALPVPSIARLETPVREAVRHLYAQAVQVRQERRASASAPDPSGGPIDRPARTGIEQISQLFRAPRLD